MSMQGSCLCGGVRFEIAEPFVSVSQCHCTNCKRISGGVGTTSGRTRTEAVRILEGEELLRPYTPAEGSAKTFCSVCGSNLFGGGGPSRRCAASGSARSTRASTENRRRTSSSAPSHPGKRCPTTGFHGTRSAPRDAADLSDDRVRGHGGRYRLAHAGIRIRGARTAVRHGGRDDRARRARDRRRTRDAGNPEPRVPEPAKTSRAARPHVAGSTTPG